MRTFSNSFVQIGTLPLNMLFQYHYHDLRTSMKPEPKPEAVVWWCSVKVFHNFAKLTEKHLRPSLFLTVAGGDLQLYQKRLQHRSFLVNFAKFLRILCLIL